MNLFIFRIPRLSVDIDLNYVGSLDREGMLEDRPKVEQAMQAVFSREGFTTRRIPTVIQKIGNLEKWAEDLSAACREKLVMILPFSDNEMEFLNALQDRGEIMPELLTDDAELKTRIANHPMLRWKALNVKEHKSRPGAD